jgi:GTPase Era involved in 16S rRNA processing
LEQVKFYQKKVIVILSKIDILSSEEELDQIADFVRKQFSKLSGTEPLIFPVSSRQALQAKQGRKTGRKGGEEGRSVFRKSRFVFLKKLIFFSPGPEHQKHGSQPSRGKII